MVESTWCETNARFESFNVCKVRINENSLIESCLGKVCPAQVRAVEVRPDETGRCQGYTGAAAFCTESSEAAE